MRPATIGLTLLLLLSGRPAGARDREIVLRQEDVGLRTMESEAIDRGKARKVLREARAAFGTIANKLALNTRSIFLLDSPRPPWAKWEASRDPRIWIVLEEEAKEKDQGSEAYLKRMRRGQLEIHLSAPKGDIDADDLHVLWREMCHAIVAQTTWIACPLWLREGMAEHFGADGAEDEHARKKALEEELTEIAADVPVAELLLATSREQWTRSGGRAVSWALVRMMEESEKKLFPSLFNQSRLFLDHLVRYPDPATVQREFAEILRGQLAESNLTADRLASALKAWVAAGFPEDSDYRRTDAHDVFRRAKLPKVFGMGLSGRFAMRRTVEDPQHEGVFYTYQPFSGGKSTWRFPWSATMQAFVGVRGRPGTNYGLQPNARRDGYFVSYPVWEVPPQGRKTLAARVIRLPVPTTKFGFIWVGVTSPNGLGYMFRQEYKLK